MPNMQTSRASLALSRLTGAEIASMLTDDQREKIAAKLGANASTAPELAKAARSHWSAEIAASLEAKRATARAVAVMSSEHATGRTKLAADLLANDKLSADEIIGILKLASAHTSAEQNAALDDMRAALAAAAAQHGGAAAAQSSNPAALWDRAVAKVKAEMAGEVGA